MNIFGLLELLSEAEIEFVLVGGLAVALQGYQRQTMDVDIVLAMDQNNLRRFIDCAINGGLKPTIPLAIDALADPAQLDAWHDEKGMLAFSLKAADTFAPVVDVLIRPVVPYPALRQDAVLIAVGALTIPVASIDHLIQMKRNTGRSKDAIDIEELEKIKLRAIQ